MLSRDGFVEQLIQAMQAVGETRAIRYETDISQFGPGLMQGELNHLRNRVATFEESARCLVPKVMEYEVLDTQHLARPREGFLAPVRAGDFADETKGSLTSGFEWARHTLTRTFRVEPMIW